MTQSVGVPCTAKRWSAILRMRRGWDSVRPWLAPLCSSSGATIQTSSLKVRAMSSSTLRPWAFTPSSLVMRIRWAEASGIAGDDLQPAHVGPQRFRHQNTAVRLLIVLHDRNEGPPHGKARAVQRMDEAGVLLARGAEAGLHAPGLEIAELGAARDLAELPLTGEPD